jgi:hypothetical protein
LIAVPGGGPGPVTFDKAHPYVPPGRGAPTYRVADLSNPILQDWVKPGTKKANDEVLAGGVAYRAHERCWPDGVPTFDTDVVGAPLFIYQRPNEIVVVMESGPEVRHIYLNVPHSANVKPSWYGESVGRYEGGDTLVIDTIGQTDRTFADNYRTPHTAYHSDACDRTLEIVSRRKLCRCLSRRRRPGGLYNALAGPAALAACAASTRGSHLCGEQRPRFRWF